MKHVLLTVLLLLTSGAATAADERDPVTLIRETTSHLLSVLDERRDEFTQNPELLHELVNADILPLIDLRYSARLILGPAARGASVEQLDAFGRALSTVLLDRYAHGLLDFRSGEQVDVLPLKGNNTDKLTRVQTRLKLERGSFVPIDYAFRRTDDGWRVFDVTVEGISYVMTFRNQIAPRAQAEGIDKVTQEIRSGTIALDTD
ncbi:MAG: ABC transporter substrate-binding protein [Xanthomonadales bacterium]